MTKDKKADLIVWIVEDVAADALIATEVVRAEALEAGLSVDVYWDNTILWDSLLSDPPPGEYGPKFAKSEQRPGIVILDLFACDGFLAESFFRGLRRFEDDDNDARSWVILWTVNTSYAGAQDLLYNEPDRDRRVVFTDSKEKLLLRGKLTYCFRSWKEARFK